MSDPHTVSQAILYVGASGRMFGCTFIKRTDGTQRHMLCRLGVRRNLTGIGQPYTPTNHNLLTVWDVQKKAYRSISLTSMLEVRGRGRKFVFGG